ncbi:hypothetical protein FNV43_RR04077 [Rhamnella rubrinervis]|uniref:MORF/ORRM1/DAG-like MORF domain-containing protein n=1 Tax=Rhamnella rubrinervis TaxID=2594499 RepID=A0A8K0MP89_9ROSA|nr:hypothetical protein FNV43_RR04077 [Rhamnella rubrinervis]
MVTSLVHRSRSLPRTLARASFLTRNVSTSASLSAAPTRSSFSLVNRLRPLVGAISAAGRVAPARCFATDTTDPKPDKLNRPGREKTEAKIMQGRDFEHWFVVMEPPKGSPTRDEIIDSYIKTLASVVGSEQEARMKIYSVSTRWFYAFGALVPEELSDKIIECPRVRWVLPDSYLDVEKKIYGGEPFINGQAVPYDPKYHEQWLSNNAMHFKPNWMISQRGRTPPFEGTDFKHWLVVMERPEDEPTRDEIINIYIKTLASVVGSEEEARMKIYSVSTRCYYAFGALVSEELSQKIKECPRVRWVLPDSYLDIRNKDYGGEPFINGQAVPYDPKYHRLWRRHQN